MRRALVPVVLGLALVGAACSSDDGDDTVAGEATTSTAAAVTSEGSGGVDPTTTDGATATSMTGVAASFTVEVWADNWAAVYANGELVGEDSVPITTERSFNAETPRTR